MARDGSGNYSLPEADFTNGTIIDEVAMNSNLGDIETALTNSIAKNGETTVTGNIKMGSKKLTGLTTGSANGDSLSLGQAQNQGYVYAVSSGTDTVTLTLSPAITAYAAGQTFRFKAGGTNTGAATLNVNAVGAKAIQMNGSALDAGQIENGKFYEVIYDGTQFQLAKWEAFSNDLPPTWLSGCTLSNGTDADHDIDIAAGVCVDSTDATKLTVSAITKQIDASWAEGTNLGGFPTGISLSADTWYHVFAIRKNDGTVDAGFDTSATATNLLADATDYTEYRRLGSVLTDATSNILAFTQVDNRFLWADPPLDISDTAQATTSETRTLSVPTVSGIIAIINAVTLKAGQTPIVYIRSLYQDDEPPSVLSAPLATIKSHVSGSGSPYKLEVLTNGSAQIGSRANVSCELYIATLGWIDSLGRDW